MKYEVYEHKTQYYETDQMGIIHHSNYIRWFEEARVHMMEQLGMGYDAMEEAGVIRMPSERISGNWIRGSNRLSF